MVTLARTSAERMPGMAVTSKAESKASGSEGARRLRVASGIEKRNPYPIRAACAKGRRHILSGWGSHHHTFPCAPTTIGFALASSPPQPVWTSVRAIT